MDVAINLLISVGNFMHTVRDNFDEFESSATINLQGTISKNKSYTYDVL